MREIEFPTTEKRQKKKTADRLTRSDLHYLNLCQWKRRRRKCAWELLTPLTAPDLWPCFVWSPIHVRARREWHPRSGISLPVFSGESPGLMSSIVDIRRERLLWEFRSCDRSEPSGKPSWRSWVVYWTHGRKSGVYWRAEVRRSNRLFCHFAA